MYVLTFHLAYFLTCYLIALTFSLANVLTVYLAFFLAVGFIDVWGSFDASLGTCMVHLLDLDGGLGALAALVVVSWLGLGSCCYPHVAV